MEGATGAIVAILTAVVGVAIVAVLVSNQAHTGEVIAAASGGFSQILQTAVSPVTGTSSTSALGGLVNGIGGSA